MSWETVSKTETLSESIAALSLSQTKMSIYGVIEYKYALIRSLVTLVFILCMISKNFTGLGKLLGIPVPRICVIMYSILYYVISWYVSSVISC